MTPTLADEKRRLLRLENYDILDTPPEREFDDIVFLAAHILEVPTALISLVDERRQWFKAKVGLAASETPREIAFCSHAIQQSGIFQVTDASADARFQSNPLVASQPHIRFYVGAPLITPDGHRIGTLCAIDYKPREPDRAQLAALEALSRQVVVLLELRRLVREKERRSNQLTLLRQMTNLLQSCAKPAEAFEVLNQFVPQLFPGISGHVFVMNKQIGVMEAVVTWGPDAPEQTAFAIQDCWALRRGKIHGVTTSNELVCRHLKDSQFRPSVCVPLSVQGETAGVLVITEDPGEPQDLNEGAFHDHAWMAEIVAEHISLTLTSLRMQETLHENSIRDPLTGLFNRRYMEETLKRELHRRLRRKEQLGVVLLDLDHFKCINDTYGHEGGDHVLKVFAEQLQKHFRADDVVCRTGGEEFVVLLPAAATEAVMRRLENFKRLISGTPIAAAGQILSAITFSAGVAMAPRNGATIAELLNAADKALYIAKGSGRNRIVCLSDE